MHRQSPSSPAATGPAASDPAAIPEPFSLASFTPATREWFRNAFAAPTPAQIGAWRAVAAGRHALVVAPTGSGKTLAAFLWSLDNLVAQGPPPDPTQRCRVLYVSPLKALAVDVERNLRAPLTGIRHAADRLGLPPPEITVATRTGDTPAGERRSFARRPSDILITTPESLYLLLTSSARQALRGVRTVIVDEVHSVCATKRGAHLALSLERLDALLARPAQRIGLSATVRPIEETARFLGGAAPVQVVAPAAAKTIEVAVRAPVPDMGDLGGEENGPPSIWPAVEEQILDLIERHRSTIVFANARRTAERLCARLNELAEERASQRAPAVAGPSARWPTPGDTARRPPAEMMAQSGTAEGAPPVVARAHHGSVSKEERRQIEDALKSGRLPAVVATSSLELGIDMGTVDLVVQVAAPPSVAAGTQRVGRAGHQVGAVSRGVVFPGHRGDLLACAVVAERMAEGAIEELRYPRNPLDVLAQQIVAAVAMEDWPVAELGAMIRRAAPFAGLPDSALHATLDMLAGRYPSTAFADLRPKLVWDRHTDVLSARPGAGRLAVTSGGTIPDRGLFGVFLAAGPEAGRGSRGGTRVGELDEEMVYESRVGDVFLLGSTSWRIEDITPDRVLVSPAPGQPARMPFWKGDTPGRPVELGRALGARLRRLARATPVHARESLAGIGLDGWAVDNVMAYLAGQRQATRALPDDRTVVVERFRDELGDWRLAVHCVLGARVNAPWALAVGHRLTQRYGFDAQVLPADDGIVVRLPDMVDEPPGADLVVFDPDEIADLVERSVGTSAMFAARFRECAARALLLPRRDPGRRSPLWQQRQRAAQLLDVAREHPDFPITLEAARECLRDVFDLAGLVELMRDLSGRRTRLVEVETARPSPFARSLLFGYVGAFLHEADAPLAERRAAALALDPTLLGELLGRVDLRELLDPAVVAATGRRLQRLPEPPAGTPNRGEGAGTTTAPSSRPPRDSEDAVELLRVLGDLTTAEAADRGVREAWLVELERAHRAIRVRIAGQERWLAVEDAGRVRDALGVALPVGLAAAFVDPGPDPLGDLVARYARTHGPFLPAAVAARFGLGAFVVEQVLLRFSATGRMVSGEFTPGGAGTEWCDAEVLRTLRRRSLAALRREIEPVPPDALARFLPAWQQITAPGRGVAGVAAAVEQLQGVAVPASALERLILPARVADYAPALLDELCASGEVVWAGAGAIGGGDGWVSLAFADAAPLVLPEPAGLTRTPLHDAVLAALAGGHALFFRALADRVRAELARGGVPGDGPETGAADPAGGAGPPGAPPTDADVLAALWDLVWAGLVSGDTLAPLRAALSGSGAHRSRPAPARNRYRRPGRYSSLTAAPVVGGVAGGGPGSGPSAVGGPGAARAVPSTASGRWYRLPDRDPDPTRRTAARADALLDRYGVVTRGAVTAEGTAGGFSRVYPVFAAQEERGGVRRGYFVEGLGAAQFALPGAVERLRATDSDNRVLVLAATDPANPYGASLPWPDRATHAGAGGPPDATPVAALPAAGGAGAGPGGRGAPDRAPGARAGRRAGALVVLIGGELVLYVERGGRTLLSYVDDPSKLAEAARALGAAVHDGSLAGLSVLSADGEPVARTPLAQALEAAGFRAIPRGLKLRGQR